VLAQLARDFQFLKCDPPACYRYYEGFRSGPAVTAEPREILLEGLIDMGSCALHDRLEAAEPHRDQFPNTGLSIRWKTAWKSDPALGVISIE